MATDVLNFNIGVLGHVDSGKTSLSKALSTVASTASFDKNPQSKERGITLDLGFSSFTIDVQDSKKEDLKGYQQIQYTLVDCPGHASLIRTIIGGAQIIDLMLLVVDITKGLQTQTAECLVIGEITCDRLMVVLNKLDLVPDERQKATLEKMKKRLWKTLENTKFAGCPIVAVAAKPGGPESPDIEAQGMTELVKELQRHTFLPSRSDMGPFVFSADHCFSIRGQGTVMTGTVLSGRVAVNDTVEIPTLGATKKVKSMQMFRTPVESIKQGDRAGLCVTQFDPSQMERGLVCSLGALVTIEAAIISLEKIAYYKGSIATKSKFHITLGHETVMGRLSVFGLPSDPQSAADKSDPEQLGQDLAATNLSCQTFSFDEEYVFLEEYIQKGKDTSADQNDREVTRQFALVELERPVTCPRHSVVIGSRLDADIHTNACRIAFHGQVLVALDEPKYRETTLPKLKVYKMKTREGLVERVPDRYSVIGKNLFKKETNLAAFANLKVTLSSGEAGTIEGGFGQSGKVKVRIPEGLTEETYQRYATSGKRKGKGKVEDTEAGEQTSGEGREPVKIFMSFKRYMYDPNKAMVQS